MKDNLEVSGSILRGNDIRNALPRAAFSRIVSLAAEMFETPVAALALSDGIRLRFVSCSGFDLPDLPLVGGLGSAAFDSGDALVVEDLAADPGLRGDPLVAAAGGMKFFAAIPLRSAEGQSRGILCILDRKRRKLTRRQLAMFAALARIAVDALPPDGISGTLGRPAPALKDPGAEFYNLAEALPQIVWTATPDGRIDYTSEHLFRLTGQERNKSLGRTWQAALHPDDIEAIRTLWSTSVATGRELSLEARILSAGTGVYRWHLAVARPVCDQAGKVVKWYGAAIDIHDRKQAEDALLEREMRLRTILESEFECVMTVSGEGALLYVNPAGLRIYGARERAEIVGRSVVDFIHHEDRAAWQALHDKAMHGESGGLALRVVGLDMMERWLEIRSAPLLRADGSIESVLSSARDITRMRSAEDALAQAQRQNSLILAAVGEGIHGLNSQGQVMFSNAAAHQMLGYEEHEVLGQSVFMMIQDRHRDGSLMKDDERPINLTLRDGKARLVEDALFVRWDGTSFPAHYTCAAIEDRMSGGIAGAVVSFRDVTKLKRSEKLASLQARVLDMIAAGEPLDKVLEQVALTVDQLAANAVSSILLVDVDGQHLRHCTSPGMPDSYREATQRLPFGQGGPCGAAAERRETVIVADIESDRLMVDHRELARALELRSCWSTPVLDSAGSVLATFAVYYRTLGGPDAADIDIVAQVTGLVRVAIERVKQREELRVSEERFRTVARSIADGVLDWDLIANTISWTEGIHGRFGYESSQVVAGNGVWMERIHPEDRMRVMGRIVSANSGPQQTWAGECRFRRADNSWARVQGSIFVIRNEENRAIRIIMSMSDITERRQLEEELRQSQRLDGVGQLTGGVAHDFNNLLTVILGNAEVLTETMTGDPKLRQLAVMIRDAAERGAELTSRLLAFARRQPLDPKPTDVRRLLIGMESLLRRSLSEDIDIQLEGADDSWNGLVDAPQLENAVLNLCLNARDAMTEGGRLTIETSNVTLDEDAVASQPDAVAGEYVMISVSDTGVGIAPEIMANVFDPFFTTKEFGKGTGLGLSMVYGFVKQSKGHVKLESELGKGTTVRLLLPRARDELAVAEVSSGLERDPVGGNEKVLVVEDNNLVRSHVITLLERFGYEVTGAASGPEALEILNGAAEFDLLFTDVVMPGGMNGRQLADAARRLRPGLRVLFTSGYSEETLVHDGRLDAGVHLLNKPYRREELAAKIRHSLDLSASG